MSNILEYQLNGGNSTLEKFRELNSDDREFMIEYIEDFAPYEVVELQNKKTFILVHSGLGDFEPDIRM